MSKVTFMNRKMVRKIVSQIDSDLYARRGFETLQWFPEYDFGFLNCDQFNNDKVVYDEKYFQKYVSYRETEICRKLNSLRAKLVFALMKKVENPVIHDFGAGACDFIKKMIEDDPNVRISGNDVNLSSVDELKSINRYALDGCRFANIVTFWDSLEHIGHIRNLLDYISVGAYVVVTIPIALDCNHAIRFKHYRTDEHYWYFTRNGFVNHFMPAFGFRMIPISEFTQERYIDESMEEHVGRSDVMTFIFRRVQLDEL